VTEAHAVTGMRTCHVAVPAGHPLDGMSPSFVAMGSELVPLIDCKRNARGRWVLTFEAAEGEATCAYRCRQLATHLDLIALRVIRKGELVLITEEAGLTFGVAPGSAGEVTEVVMRGEETLYRVKLLGESEIPRASELLLFNADVERLHVVSDYTIRA